MYKYIFTALVLLVSYCGNSQENFTSIYPDSLKINANAVLRMNNVEIALGAFNKLTIKTKRIVTVFNELGLEHVNAIEYFDKSTAIKKMEVAIYNSTGALLKKIKKDEFKEHAVNESALISNNRVLYLEYTPIQYPITFVFESEVNSSNTAFIPTWYPIENYNLGIEHSSIKVNFSPEVQLKYKEVNTEGIVNKIASYNSFQFSVQNIKPVKKEEIAPSLTHFTPYIMFGLEKFNLEGVTGYSSSWEVFGKWMYQNLLKDTEEIPDETIQKLKTIIGSEKNQLKIAKIIYQYVQDKTRYVSVQLGIGGWKPMYAKDVDRLGYGDCKALTNYTRSLLKIFEIPSFYTIVYGNKNKRDLVSDFVSMQGNHVILGIPNDQEITWLECTSQTQPFGFLGDFTDDRKVLIINEETAKITSTQAFKEADNSQKTIASINLLNNGDIECKASLISEGIIYDNKIPLVLKSKDDLTKYYKELIDNVNNKSFSAITINHSKEQLKLEENIEFIAKEFAKKNGQIIIMPINLINPLTYIPIKYKDRKHPFQINRGYLFEDEVTLTIPQHFILESIPTGNALETLFGEYQSTITSIDAKTIKFKRRILIKEGFYNANQYEDYRKFREQIAKYENLKIVLNTN